MAAKSTDNPKGWYPGADRIGVPLGNFTAGNLGRRAVVIHIMDGTLISTISWFANPKSGVSAHFGIDKQGHAKQFVSIYDSSFANGLTWSEQRKCWIDPAKNALKAPNPSPTWELIQPPINPNLLTITIEREGKPTDTPTSAMVRATVDILDWLGDTFSSLRPYVVGRSLIGHSHIAPVHRARCPGPNAGLPMLATAANGPQTDPFAAWGDIDRPEGEARGFAIARTWLANRATLGACIRGERYDVPGKISRALFQRGEVRYAGGTTEVFPYPGGFSL